MKLTSLVLLLLTVSLFVACSDDQEEICETTNLSYTNEISDILNSNCALSGCHVNGNETNAFFSFQGYDNVKAAVDFGRIIGAINHEAGFSAMPKGGNMLDDCTIDKITAWINAGAPE